MTAQEFADVVRERAAHLPQHVIALTFGYRVESIDPPGQAATIICSAQQALCECVSFRWGGACVHLEAVRRHVAVYGDDD